MNLDFLASYRVFARTLNFTHAAAERHVSQPALHKQIRSLGESLGVSLYQRVGRGLVLTDAGLRLARLAGELSERIAEFQIELQQQASKHRVGLAAGRGAFLYLLGRAIQGYVKQGAQLALLTTDRDQTLHALVSGQAHLGVTVLSSIPDGFTAELIREVQPHLILKADHPFAGRRWIDLARLSTLPLILPPQPSVMRQALATIFEHESYELRVSVEAKGWEVMMHFASLGLGAAIVNGCCRPPRGTVAVPIRQLPSSRYFLLHCSDLYFSDQVKDLRARILRSAERATLFS